MLKLHLLDRLYDTLYMKAHLLFYCYLKIWNIDFFWRCWEEPKYVEVLGLTKKCILFLSVYLGFYDPAITTFWRKYSAV